MDVQLSSLGISQQKEKQFNTKKIHTVRDLVNFYPIGYRDYRKLTPVKDLEEGMWTVVLGEVKEVDLSNPKISSVYVEDENGDVLRVNWFHSTYHAERLTVGVSYYFAGKISSFGFYSKEFCMNCPELYDRSASVRCIYPRYSKIRGMSREYHLGYLDKALEVFEEFPLDPEKESLSEELDLMPIHDAIREYHAPRKKATFRQARKRHAFDTLYDFYDQLLECSTGESNSVVAIHSKDQAEKFVQDLPFELTEGQVDGLKEMQQEIESGKRLDCLLLGDVGSGKTVLAVAMGLLMAENGGQTMVLSPTQVLAGQNHKVFQEYLASYGVRVDLLHSSMKKKERDAILAAFASGETQILVGTHSLLSDEIVPSNLGLIVIDEEHRFGVKQKEAIIKRLKSGISRISMTATPIPRTLGLSLFGSSIKVIQVKTKPKGRKPVETKMAKDLKAITRQIREEVESGNRCYVVCPFVDESESESMAGVHAANQVCKELKKQFKGHPDIVVDKVSGDMKSEDVDKKLKRYVEGKINVLVSTTIIEVGVNVPEATLIAILSAERFGLAQLHQLRGRVGRGELHSTCLLLANKDSERLQCLLKTTDGFALADEDLRLRGAGALSGIVQSGYSREVETVLQFPDLARDVRLALEARKAL